MSHLRHRRIFLASLAGFLLCNSTAFSQEPACMVRKLPVSFRDAQNLPIQNLSVADLEAKVRGKPVKILSLALDPRPHRIVLILDTSGSMGSFEGESALWNLELSLARHFFEMNRKRSQIALLFFDNQVNDIVNFASGNSAVDDMLQQVLKDRNYLKNHIRGKTALRDAILQGVQLLDHPSSADAVFALTDGGDNGSHQTRSELDNRLAITGVRLFAILLQKEARYRNRTPEELSGPGELSEITRKSGGEILTAAAWHGDKVALSANAEAKVKSEENLSRLYQTIFQDSLLEVKLPFPNARNENWELNLTDRVRREWKGAQITYPTTLISCTSEVSGSGRH
jgi:Mg-chelatase subunit ChlD